MERIEKICVIDDDDIYQFLLKKELKSTNLLESTVVFNNGSKAIDYILTAKDAPETLPDVIFLDINMPIMDGWFFFG
jgi:CheY-like chemotaxis protein